MIGLWRRVQRSLSSKLALIMVLVALLPLVIVSSLGARIALGRLERNLMAQTRETALIALNVLLGQVQAARDETVRLAETPELHELVALDPDLVPRFLEARARLRTSGLVEVALLDRTVVGRVGPPHKRALARLTLGASSPALERALNYEQFLTLERHGDVIAVRSAAPIVDSSFVVRGAVVVTLPLDEQMADSIRGVVQAEVGFLVDSRPVASTFVDDAGLRLAGVAPPVHPAHETRFGGTALSVARVAGRDFAMAFTPLQNAEGARLGLLAVGVDRHELTRAKASAVRSLFLGALGGLIFAVVIAYVVGRRITTPVARLRESAQAITAGDLDLEVPVVSDDEIGDLGRAFQTMTRALREHQERLAARVREISTLHQIGRAVSSVIGLDQVLKLVITEVCGVLGADRGVLLLEEEEGFRARAAVGLPGGPAGDPSLPEGWSRLAEAVASRHGALVEQRTLAVPLETRERVIGALVVARRERAGEYSDGDLRLVATFCDQAATAIENARLYDEVRTFSAELERLVARRTAELQQANRELERALQELKDAQSQLIHSEKMATLGTLVAGVAHEINTPAGAIQGSVQALGETLDRLAERMRGVAASSLNDEERALVLAEVAELGRELADAPREAPRALRQHAREVAAALEQHGVGDAPRLARRIVEAGAAVFAPRIVELAGRVPPSLLVGLVEDTVSVRRSSRSIQTSIAAVVRLVGTLKRYTHADRAAVEQVDLTEGIETTLTILHNVLRYGITVSRRYSEVPQVPVFVDELNQVWTNLIQNCIQALGESGEIEIETFREGEEVGVRITDNGPGISAEVMPRIFEPFFTTKPRGEGSGLGLSIVQRIIDRHGGRITVESQPGRTAFTVRLPLAGPPGERGWDAH